MRKNKIIIGSLVVVIMCLLLINIIPLKPVDTEIALAIRDNDSTKVIRYGVNHRYLKETSPNYSGLSITIDLDEVITPELMVIPESTKHVQVILESSNGVFERDKLQQVQEMLLPMSKQKSFYIHLKHHEKMNQNERELDYDYMEQLLAETDLQLIYHQSIDHINNQERPIKYLNVEIRNQQDIENLKLIQEILDENEDTTTCIIINDYIVESNQDLTVTLDLINRLYYDIALYTPNVIWINQQSNLGIQDVRIAEAYEVLLEQPWLSREVELEEYVESPYKWIDVEELLELEGDIEYILPLQKEVEYVDYKLNGESLGQVFRYPYTVSWEEDTLENSYNELRAIVKFEGEEEVVVENVYFKTNLQEVVLEEKLPRKTPSYDVSEQMNYTQPYIPVLMYHEFKDTVEEHEQSIAVETKLFEEQIIALLDEGYTPITFLDLKYYFEGVGGLPAQPVILTTDDGYLSNYLITYPILKKYNVPATYFVTSAYVGVMTAMPHFTWEEAFEMEQSGLIDIQSHTHTHPAMNQLSEAAVKYQVGHSFETIEKYLGKRDVYALSYPQFLHSEDTLGWLSEMGVDFQNTDLNKGNEISTPVDIKRIHVSNETMPEDLIQEIQRLTLK